MPEEVLIGSGAVQSVVEQGSVFGRIYVITCSVNGRQYVGKTQNRIKARLSFHKFTAKHRYKPSIIFSSAIRKYGIDSFSIKEIDTAGSLEELNNKETFHIRRLNTLFPNGYNMNEGGYSARGSKLSQEHKDAISRSRKGKKLACNNGPLSSEHRNAISVAKKNSKFAQEKEAILQKKIADLMEVFLEANRLAGKADKTSFRCGHPFTKENAYPLFGVKFKCRQCIVKWQEKQKQLKESKRATSASLAVA
jgi:group I intron endonuclease